MRGFTERLRKGGKSYNAAQRNELIEVLADEATDLANLIEDLATATETSNAALSITPEPCDLRRLVYFGEPPQAAPHA